MTRQLSRHFQKFAPIVFLENRPYFINTDFAYIDVASEDPNGDTWCGNTITEFQGHKMVNGYSGIFNPESVGIIIPKSQYDPAKDGPEITTVTYPEIIDVNGKDEETILVPAVIPDDTLTAG